MELSRTSTGEKVNVMSLELNNSIAFNISRVGVLLRRALIHALKEYNVTPEQWQVILTLYNQTKPLSQREITYVTTQDRHAMSRLISRLQKNGWIEKTKSPDDSRATLISLTSKGRQQKDEMHVKLTKHTRGTVFASLSADEKKTILELMKKIRINLGDM